MKAIVDIHTLKNNYWKWDLLPCNNIQYSEILETLHMRPDLRRYLLFLEFIVIFDSLIVDKNAYEKYLLDNAIEKEFPENIKHFIEFHEITIDIYQTVLKKTMKYIDILKSSGKESKLYQLFKFQYMQAYDPFWITEDKEYIDHYGYNFDHKDHSWLADSNNSLGRAIFYLELSSIFNAPILLSEEKKDWLEIIGNAVRPNIHERLVKFVDIEIKKIATSFLEEYHNQIDLPVSPIIELIIMKSLKSHSPFSETILEMRENPSVKDYRNYLDLLNESFAKGNRGLIEIGTILKPLKNAISQWVEHLDLDLELTRKLRTFKIEKLPYIGDLLSFFNLSDIHIKNYLLNQRPGYLTFIASWYGRKN